MPKTFQNDAKMETKIDEHLYMFRKGWNARNYLFYNRKRVSGRHEKTLQNRCKIYVRKRHAKSIVDAERHRRTPRLSAISGKAIDAWVAGFFGAVAASMRDAGRYLVDIGDAGIQISLKFKFKRVKQLYANLSRNYCKMNDKIIEHIMPKPSKYRQNGSPNRCKIHEKSMLRF